MGSKFCQVPDGTGSGIDCGTKTAEQVSNVRIADCTATAQGRGIFFRQGKAGQGLFFENNHVSGYESAVVIDGAGGALLRANRFERVAKPVVAAPEAEWREDANIWPDHDA